MRKILSIILITVLLLPNFAFAADLTIQDEVGQYTIVTESETWNETKTINKNLIVSPGVVITVSSGVTVNFNANLIIFGEIKNNGTLNLNGYDLFANNVNMGFMKLTGDTNYLEYGVMNPYGRTTNVGDLNVKTDLYPTPPVSLEVPENNIVKTNTYTLKGHTVPGFKIKNGGVETISQTDGSFELPLTLNDGENTIELSITDVFQQEFVLEPQILTVIPSIEVDDIPPSVIEVTPLNGSENIGIDTPINIAFDEEILKGAAFSEITIKDSNAEPVLVESKILKDTLTLIPNQPLHNNEQYYLTVPENSITDTAGNNLTEIFTLSFKTVVSEEEEIDESPPVLVETSPLDNSTDVSVEQSIDFLFEKEIQPSTNFENIKVVNSENSLIPVHSVVQDNTLTVSSEQKWDYGTQYTVTIPAGSIVSVEGFSSTEEYMLSFTTAEKLEEEVRLPEKPVVKPFKEGSTKITGTAAIGTTVFVQLGEEVWSSETNEVGEFTIEVGAHEAGTELMVFVKDSEERESVKVALVVSKALGSVGGTQFKGKISDNTVWTKANSPYILAGEVEVTDGASLTLEPGVEVLGQNNRLVIVKGTFESRGDSEERVVIENTIVDGGYYSEATMKIQYTDFNGGTLQKSGTGDLILEDSLLNSSTKLYLSETNSTVARNTIKLQYFYMDIDSAHNHVIKNNLFYSGFNAEASQRIYYYGNEWGNGETLFEHNSVIGMEGSSRYFFEIYNSSKGLKVNNNYWNTIDEEEVYRKINGIKDKASSGTITSYMPFLTTPHSETPNLDVLTVTNVSPEPNAYGVAVNSEVSLSFSQEIDSSKLMKERIYFHSEETAEIIRPEIRVEKEKVILSLPQGLETNKRYRVHVSQGAVTGVDNAALIESPNFSFLTSTTSGPSIPSVNEVTDKTIAVTGEAEPRALITVKLGYIILGTSHADGEGKYSVPILKQKAGNKLNVTATNAAGHISLTRQVIVVDATPPELPKVNAVNDKSTKVEGTAEADTVITVKEGALILGSGTVSSEGAYSITIPKQKAGLKLSVSAKDAAGNTSEEKIIVVSDATAPKAPTVDAVSDKSSSVTGKAEAGSRVLVKNGHLELGTATTLKDETFSVAISKQDAGTNLTVTAADEAGNISSEKVITVIDATAPIAPTVNDISDQSELVTGKAEADSIIEVKTDTKVIGTAKATSNGEFSIAIEKQKADTQLIISATDASGNKSKETVLVVSDVTAPIKPVVKDVTDQSVKVTGNAEENSSISVKVGEIEIGKAEVALDGTFSVSIEKQKAGTPLSISATDKAGNTSKATIVTVIDITAPTAPTVNEVTDQSEAVTGSAEGNSIIEVKVGSSIIGTAKATSDGEFTIAIEKQKAETQLTITAADATGNKSEETKIEVSDITAPIRPTVEELTDKSIKVTGKAEVDSLIEVKVGEKIIGANQTGVDGNFSIAIEKQKAETMVSVTAKDKAGNTSEASVLTVSDATAPEAPFVNAITDKSEKVTGKAEIDSLIHIENGDEEIGKATTTIDGTFEIEIEKQSAGKKLSVFAVDKAGNTSDEIVVVVIDVTAPEKPIVAEVTDAAIDISGLGEAHSLISIKDGTQEIAKTTTKVDGTFSASIEKQKAGTKLSVTATDSAGNKSTPVVLTVVDVTAPNAPTVNPVTDQSDSVTGQAEANSVVKVRIGTTVIGTATASGNGEFLFGLEKQKAGTKLTIASTDVAGNTSEESEVIVSDATPPEKPIIEEVTNESMSILGKAEANSAISIKVGEQEISSTTVKTDGTFSAAIEKQRAGTKLTIRATDKAGNSSEATIITVVDIIAPAKPQVDQVTDQSESITGEAEANSEIKVKAGSAIIGTAKATTDGRFTVDIERQKAETQLTIIVTDMAGNTSEAVVVKVSDATAPAKPFAEEVTDQSIKVMGTAEANSFISVKAGTTEIGSAEATNDGKFSITIEKQQAGTMLTLTAKDKAGNTSVITKVTVKDVTAPALPTVEKVTDKTTQISGKAEAGSEIVVKAGTKTLVQGKADANGKYLLTIEPQLAGTELTINAIDAAGNQSAEKKITVVKATSEPTDRISGTDRYTTAIAISKAGWSSADTVVLATASDFPDALAGGPLAYQENAPILLTRSKALSGETKQEIERLGAKNVLILGSNGAVSQDVEIELKRMGLTTERLGGKTRFETAALIAGKMDSDKAIVANGLNFPDVLSVSSYAAKNGVPILLTRTERLPDETASVLKDVSKTYVIGSTGVVSKAIYEGLPGPTRFGGKDRYETGYEVATKLPLGNEKAFIATGSNFPDALAGSVLAAKDNAPILLVRPDQIPEMTNKQLVNYDGFAIFGGTGAVSDSVKSSLDAVLKNK